LLWHTPARVVRNFRTPEPEELADDDELDVDVELLDDADEDWADLERQIVSLAEPDDD